MLLPGAELLEVLPTELPRESLYADALLRVRIRGKIYIVHLEVQTGPDGMMFARILQYMGLVWLREKVPVLPIVLYLLPVTTPESPWQLDGPMGPINTLHYTVIKLWEQPVEEWLAGGVNAALIFAPLLKDATIETVGQAAELLGQLPDDAERGNALNYLVMFAIRRFSQQTVATYLKENMMLDQFVLESEWYNIILERGTKDGLEKGMAQGIEQGIARGEQRLAQRALERRHGALAPDIIAALEHAEEATLEDLVVNGATDTIEQVRERLGLPATNTSEPNGK